MSHPYTMTPGGGRSRSVNLLRCYLMDDMRSSEDTDMLDIDYLWTQGAADSKIGHGVWIKTIYDGIYHSKQLLRKYYKAETRKL